MPIPCRRSLRGSGLHRRVLLSALVLCLLLPPILAESYRGFSIDSTAVSELPGLPPLLNAVRQQIDMVHAVSLPEETLTFLQSVGLKILPRDAFRQPTPGRYRGRGDRKVHLSAGIVRAGAKPILLHELLHAYHDQQIERGYQNPVIRGLYEEAKGIAAFAPRSHMMTNAAEYFACTATTYLYGVTAQEPFQREKLQQHQSACFGYLQSLFGPEAGRYAGSLTIPPDYSGND